jgi:hypothetical protein
MLRELDVEEPAFCTSTTGALWFCLERDVPLSEVVHVEQGFLQEFRRKYQPIPLPGVVMEDEADEGNAGN